MRSMIASLSQSIDKVSEIHKKIQKIDKKDNRRSMKASLSQSIDKMSEIYKKYHELTKKNRKINLRKT